MCQPHLIIKVNMSSLSCNGHRHLLSACLQSHFMLSVHCPTPASLMLAGDLSAGVYLCIKAYAEVNLTYSLRATLSDCPADFLPSGQQLLCSSPLGGDSSQQRYTQCAPDGTCVCKPPYNKPVDDVYPCERLACPSPILALER